MALFEELRIWLAGLVDVDGTLYMLGQKSRALYTFNSVTGKDRKKIAEFTDDPEQIVFACWLGLAIGLRQMRAKELTERLSVFQYVSL